MERSALLDELGVFELAALACRARIDLPGPPLNEDAAAGDDLVGVELRKDNRPHPEGEDGRERKNMAKAH